MKKKVSVLSFWVAFLALCCLALAPINIAAGKPVSASNTHATTQAKNITDGNPATAWNSGATAPQWVMIDLQGTFDISKIRLVPSQSPPGTTTHEILITTDLTNWTLADKITGHTQDKVAVERSYPTPLRNVMAVKVLTSASPSWVAWYDIEVFGERKVASPRPGRERGVVKYYNAERGFGHAERDSGPDVFFRTVDLDAADRGKVKVGTQIEFTVLETAKGPEATKLTILP